MFLCLYLQALSAKALQHLAKAKAKEKDKIGNNIEYSIY